MNDFVEGAFSNAERFMSQVNFDDLGLIPAVIQNAQNDDVLMLAWMNAESLSATLREQRTVFWSRSRQELWRKGETSGSVQEVVAIALDCDGDTLLVRVNQRGPACHTGTETCFSGRTFSEVTHD